MLHFDAQGQAVAQNAAPAACVREVTISALRQCLITIVLDYTVSSKLQGGSITFPSLLRWYSLDRIGMAESHTLLSQEFSKLLKDQQSASKDHNFIVHSAICQLRLTLSLRVRIWCESDGITFTALHGLQEKPSLWRCLKDHAWSHSQSTWFLPDLIAYYSPLRSAANSNTGFIALL